MLFYFFIKKKIERKKEFLMSLRHAVLLAVAWVTTTRPLPGSFCGGIYTNADIWFPPYFMEIRSKIYL